jgi:hypothetical protein
MEKEKKSFKEIWNVGFKWDPILLGATNKLCLTIPNDLFKPKQTHWKYIETIWNGWK